MPPSNKINAETLSLPVGWTQWTGLLMAEGESSRSSAEAALRLWLLFQRDADAAPSVRLETRFTVLQQYTLSGALDVAKRTIHFTQTCLPHAQHAIPWHTRDFSAAITVAPHEDQPGKLKWQLEGTFFSTAPLVSGGDKARIDNSSGSFYLEAIGHTHGSKRRSLGGLASGASTAVSIPRNVDLVWEELPLSTSSSSTTQTDAAHSSLRVPFRVEGGLIRGSSASLGATSGAVLWEGAPFTVSGYLDADSSASADGPSFEFSLQRENSQARVTYAGRVTAERDQGAADLRALRLRGTRTHLDAARGIFEFQGPFTLRLSDSTTTTSQKQQQIATSPPSAVSSPRPAVPVQSVATSSSAVVDESSSAEVQRRQEQSLAEDEARAKADAEAASAAEAALAAELHAKAEEEIAARIKSFAVAVPTPSSIPAPSAKAASATSESSDGEHEQRQRLEALAAQRKAALEAASLRRREAMKAEAVRLRALADASQAQLDQSKAARLAAIEAAREAIAAARREEEADRSQSAADDRRKAKRAGLAVANPSEWDEDVEGDIGGSSKRVGPTHHEGVAAFHRPTAEDLIAAAAAEQARQMLPVRLRAPPPPMFDYLKNHDETGILAHVFDLLSVAAPPPLSVDFPLRDVLQASAAAAQPLTPGALLPLTLLFGPEGLPQAAYHTDTHGCIRRNEWSTLDPRAVFLKFEGNANLQRAALAAAILATSSAQSAAAAASAQSVPEDELAATLLTLDGSLPALALTLLDVGVLLKNGLGAVRSIPAAYSNTAQGFIVQNMVFPSMLNPAATSTGTTAGSSSSTANKSALHLPHMSVYRVDFSSAHHLEVEKRTNRYAILAPSSLPGGAPAPSGKSRTSLASSSASITPHMRVTTFKSPDAERLVHSELLSGRADESAAHRDTFALLRRICVAILKRVNDKCRAEDVVVQRLCLYFAVDLCGPVHLLYGDRIDLRLPHGPAEFSAGESEKSDASQIVCGQETAADEQAAIQTLSATYASSPLRRAPPPKTSLKPGTQTWQ